MRQMLWVLLFAFPVSLVAKHRPVLPQPQETEYRSGRLALRGLTIGFDSTPSPEDVFAAKELSSALPLTGGEPIPVEEIRPSGLR